MTMFYALAVLCLSSTAMSQITGIGRCPKIDTMPNFEIAKIEGIWYEARRYLITTEVTLKCVKSEYQTTDKNDTVILNTSEQSIVTGTESSVKGLTVKASDPKVPGQLEIKDPQGHKYRDYAILGTDYTSYIVGYNCVDLLLANLKYLWILSTVRSISDEALEKALGVMKDQKLQTKTLVISDQSNCEDNETTPGESTQKPTSNPETTQKPTSEAVTTQNTTPEPVTTQKTTPQAVTTEKTTPQAVTTEKTTPQAVTTQETTSEAVTTQRTTTDGAAAETTTATAQKICYVKKNSTFLAN